MSFEPWREDLRLAGLGLLRARAFTGAAVLTLALGMAASTTMFALIEGVLLRPLPVPEQERLLVACLRLAGLGAALGLTGALALTRLLRGLLYGVHPLDPLSLLAAALLLVGVSALASSLPARRATRVDPMSLLRAE